MADRLYLWVVVFCEFSGLFSIGLGQFTRRRGPSRMPRTFPRLVTWYYLGYWAGGAVMLTLVLLGVAMLVDVWQPRPHERRGMRWLLRVAAVLALPAHWVLVAVAI